MSKLFSKVKSLFAKEEEEVYEPCRFKRLAKSRQERFERTGSYTSPRY